MRILIILSFIIFSCGKREKPQDNYYNKNALDAIKKEANVIEAIITDAGVIYVSVIDNGNKDGFATYLCRVVRENNSKIGMVKVVQAGTTNAPAADNAYGKLLGSCMCK